MKDVASKLYCPRAGRPGGANALSDYPEERKYLWNGAFQNGYLFRYGNWMPDVMVASERLIVSGRIRDRLEKTSARFELVRGVLVTDPSVDWREWRLDWGRRIRKLRRALDADDAQDLVMPWDAFLDADGAFNGPTTRRGMMERTDMEVWCVMGSPVLRQERVGDMGLSMVQKFESSGGVYAIPWSWDYSVCVEGWVADVLMRYGNNEDVYMEELAVAGG